MSTRRRGGSKGGTCARSSASPTRAYRFLRFLLRFREGTSRPIVVVGNNRYGRQWVVEPLEDLLGDGFTLRYDGVPSHTSMRLTVAWARNFEQSADNTGPWTPDAFPMEFVREMDRDMPHVVVADGKSIHAYQGDMMLSRASKIYANWVAAFNDVRAEGRRSAYWGESCLPEGHLRELVHWFEFVRLRRQLAEWVSPGPTYRVGLWAPQPTETIQLGEIRVPYTPPELDTDRPQFVLANPMFYETASLPEELRDTEPYYFDGPERYVQEEIVFGFGPYGFQPAVKGTMTATFVAAVQRGDYGGGAPPDAAGGVGQSQSTYDAIGTICDPRITRSRVSNGTPCTTLVAAMSSSAGSLSKSRRVDACATARSIGQHVQTTQYAAYLPVVEPHVDSTELDELGQLPQHYGRD